MNYQWRMNTMVGDERDLEHELQSGKSHRRDTRKRSKHRSKFRRRCRGLGRWCSKCCRRQEDTDSDSIKSDASFFKRRRRRKKRKRIENREEVEDEEEDGTSEEQASSEASGVPERGSEEDLPREKRRKSRRKRRKLGRSSEDSLFKASEEAEEREREEELQVLEATTAETPHYHHAYKYHKNDQHRKSEEKPKHFPTSQEFDYDSRKVEKARKRHGPGRKLDFEKSCCYICARNSMAIAAAKTSKCHRPSQVSSHAFQAGAARKETCDKSCNPILNVRTVQSWVRVRTCDKCTIFPESKKKEKGKHKSKYKKFGIFPKVKLTKCPATRTVACETDKYTKQDDKKKHNKKHERCCGETKTNRF